MMDNNYGYPKSNPLYQTSRNPNGGPIDQLLMCCGLDRLARRPEQRALIPQPMPYFYGNNNVAPNSSWALATTSPQHQQPYVPGQQQHQLMAALQQQQQNPGAPYILLTQPVILTTNSVPNQQTNTMTLFQHAQTAGNPGQAAGQFMANPFATLPWTSYPQTVLQNGLISSQYAIYQSSAAPITTTNNLNGLQLTTASPISRPSILSGDMINDHPSVMDPIQRQLSPNLIYASTNGINNVNNNNNVKLARPEVSATPMPGLVQTHHLLERPQTMIFSNQQNTRDPTETSQPPPNKPTTVRTLNAETFRQLELIEKQTDLRMDMMNIERFGVVITRAISPSSLRPHLTDATLNGYYNLIGPQDDYAIRFIEVIKRPGQTLGLYIRSVQVNSNRVGLVITKIESDSPVYNSQVLHIGDEILSINLIDIQGMSIDDVVIIMSLPRRLILAMRVPVNS